MQATLIKGDRIRIVMNGGAAHGVRVKENCPNGFVRVSFAKSASVDQGTPVELEHTANGCKRIFYMQVHAASNEKESGLLLRRNPGAHFNKRRRGLRLPFKEQTAVRLKGAPHFLSARFSNINMEGAFLLSEAVFAVDAVVDIKLQLPENSVHIIRARVIRTYEKVIEKDAFDGDLFGIAVAFAPLPRETAQQLALFLWRRIRETLPRELCALLNPNVKGRAQR